jgi:hypothetical protein
LQSFRKHAIAPYEHWEMYFKRGLEEAGCEWLEAEGVDWAEPLVPSEAPRQQEWREAAWARTLDQIRRQHDQRPIDCFLGYLYPAHIDPAAIREIQALGIPCVNFFCDNVREFVEVPAAFRCFDLHWVPEFKALSMYRRAGLRHLHAPMPAWVNASQRTWDHPEKYGVTFIGSWDSQRAALFARVLALGRSVELRGAGWDGALVPCTRGTRNSAWQTVANQISQVRELGSLAWLRKISEKLRPPIPADAFARFVQPKAGPHYVSITQESRIILGVNRYPSLRHPFTRPDTYSRLRDIEAPMMGACYLTEWTEGLDQLYDLGSEIETYRTAEEMVDKIRALEASPSKRRQLRRRGQQRALREHTVCRTVDKIAHALGLRAGLCSPQ